MSIIYDDFINMKKIYPVKITSYEIGWRIKDINDVLQWLNKNNQIVLGGDIIDSQKNYTYDNWFYNYNHLQSVLENVNTSIAKALDYTSNYLKNNGDDYYVVLILK